MKNVNVYTTLLALTVAGAGLWSCETVIDPRLEDAEPVLTVDAWLTTKPGEQTIKLTQSQAYFNTADPQGVSGAQIQVVNETDQRVFVFTEQSGKPGQYTWMPSSPSEVIGQPGDIFSLAISQGGDQFVAESYLGRVPTIDSISFILEKASAFFPESYQAEFWATDPVGPGDTYWIKAYKNDTLLLRPSEINIAYDAGFSAGGVLDGVTFITPIRRGINPFDVDENDLPLSPYDFGDSVYVEIHSISAAAFNFLNEVVVQIDRPGGFSELFASPLANVSTNIIPVGNNKKVVGFFNVASVSSAGKRLVKK